MIKSLRIIHLVVDDKFIGSVYELYEELVYGSSKYYILSGDYKCNYINKTPVISVGVFWFLNKDFIKDIKESFFVVIHSMLRLHAS